MIDTLGQSTLATLSLDLPSVGNERSLLFDHFQLWSVDRNHGLGFRQPVLGVVEVGTRGRLVVMHDTTSSEEVVNKVAGEGDAE